MSESGSKSAYPKVVDRLIERFAELPGIGRRSAERLAFHVLKGSKDDALALAKAISDAKVAVRNCRVCWNLSDQDTCEVCDDPKRDRGTVLVVEQPKDLISIEQTGMFRGIYHVLMGRLSPLDNIGPGDLTVQTLIERVEDPAKNCGGVAIREVVLGLNPTVEGDGTAVFLGERLREIRVGGGVGGGVEGVDKVRVTRLARGVPTGSQLEYANKAVLADAIQCRQAIG